jgi:regulator of protease activity HflC (stomatin/prohibitin superfamily)
MAIEQKKLAYELKQAAEMNAQRTEAEARGSKLAMIQQAEGKAESVRLSAEARLYSQQKEAEGLLAVAQAEAEGKAALTRALGGGQYVVQLEFARNLSDRLQVWGVPVGSESNSIMDLSGLFGKMYAR